MKRPTLRPLSILLTADPELPVPPRLYGGIERVIALLIDGLVQRGHSVTLLAHGDSHVPCDLVAYRGVRSGSMEDTIHHARQLAREVRRRRPDLIHSFGRLGYLLPVLASRVPKIMCYQRAVTARTVRWANRLAHGTLSFVGCSQRLIDPVAAIGRWRVVYNAVPLDRYQFTRVVAADSPLVFLGRIEHIKGTHVAIEVARAAGRRLVIAGNRPDGAEHAAYFANAIRPHVDGDRVVYMGPVDDAAKNELLGRASALLMPVLWDEPFGIVMAEALACGTPVVGLDRGAVREVVDDGVTGFVCRDPQDMIRKLAGIGGVNREACRRAAESRFSGEALVTAFEAVYQSVLAPMHARVPGDHAPQSV